MVRYGIIANVDNLRKDWILAFVLFQISCSAKQMKHRVIDKKSTPTC